MGVREIPLSLYVHFPWCVKKCPYCDFNSHALKGEIPELAYVDALIKDFKQSLLNIKDRQIKTIFIGGGTPSLISPMQIKRMLDAVRGSGQLSAQAEITLEANPGALDESNFEAYLVAGVNRLSVGVQSFDDALLKIIGRVHDASDAKQAVIKAQKAGFKRINMDLMYALPSQSIETALLDLEQALALETEHLSVCQLTLEPNTQFAHRPPPLPDSDLAWQMQLQTQAVLSKAGFVQYEVSAYSQAAQCQHNLNYWQFGDYLAIGAGAHGKLSLINDKDELEVKRYWNHRHPKAYIKAHDSGDFCAEVNLVLSRDRNFEYLMNALRLKKGFTLEDYAMRTKGDALALLQQLHPFFEQKWLIKEDDQIRTTALGYRFLDSILLECLPN